MDSTDEDHLKTPTAATQETDLATARDVIVQAQQKVDENTDQKRLKCVVVGDPLVGKTSLIHAFSHGSSISKDSHHLLLPGVLGVQERKVLFEKKIYTLIIHDTDYNKENRLQLYANADLIILCYSVADPNSLRNVERKWIPELTESAAGKTLMLIGCKVDMREREEVNFYMDIVGEFEGMHMSAAIDSQAWFECSAQTMVNITRVFEEVPPSVERHRYHKSQALQIAQTQPQALAVPGQVAQRQPTFFQTLGPVLRQSYQNIVACLSNPGAFVERKKAIVSYVPMLKSFIPYEEDVETAREFVHPKPKSEVIQQQELKRLLVDKDPNVNKQDDSGSKRSRGKENAGSN